MDYDPIPVALPPAGPEMTRPLAVVLAELAKRVLELSAEDEGGAP